MTLPGLETACRHQCAPWRRWCHVAQDGSFVQVAAQFHVQYRKRVALAVGLIAAECFKSEVPVNGLGRAVLLVYVNVDGAIPVGGSAYQLLAEPFPYVRRGYKQRFNLAILYADESVAINKGTLEVSKATYERAKELFNEGSISKADLAQLEAQVSNDEYQLITSESSLRDYKLQLKQLLELDGTAEMDLVIPTLDETKVMQLLPNQQDIYQAALAQRPEIQSSKLSIENAKLAISSAKAGYLPTISLSASTSSMTNNASQNNWAEQMKYGWNNMLGVTLSIPIFDNRQNKTAVQKARIQYDNSLLSLTNQEKELYKTIESLWLDALNAQQQFAAADSKLKSSQTSFDLVNEQFSLGMKNTVELLTEKNNLLSAQQQRIQAKYMAILNRTLLDFYAGEPIKI